MEMLSPLYIFSILLPTSLRTMMASQPNTPEVSIPTGTKWGVHQKFARLWRELHRLSSVSIAQGSPYKSSEYEEPNVSGQVASPTRTFTNFYSILVAPSVPLPSSRSKPGGSKCNWILAESSGPIDDIMMAAYLEW